MLRATRLRAKAASMALTETAAPSFVTLRPASSWSTATSALEMSLNCTAGGVAGQAQGIVPIGRVHEIIATHFQRGRPRVQGVGIVACITGELFRAIAPVGGPLQLAKFHRMSTAMGLVGPGVKASLLPVGFEMGGRFA